jgi:hypothetical protein
LIFNKESDNDHDTPNEAPNPVRKRRPIKSLDAHEVTVDLIASPESTVVVRRNNVIESDSDESILLGKEIAKNIEEITHPLEVKTSTPSTIQLLDPEESEVDYFTDDIDFSQELMKAGITEEVEDNPESDIDLGYNSMDLKEVSVASNEMVYKVNQNKQIEDGASNPKKHVHDQKQKDLNREPSEITPKKRNPEQTAANITHLIDTGMTEPLVNYYLYSILYNSTTHPKKPKPKRR